MGKAVLSMKSMSLEMGFKLLKWKSLIGLLARCLVLKALFFSLVIAVILFTQSPNDFRTLAPLTVSLGECTLKLVTKFYLNLTQFLKPVSALAFPIIEVLSLRPCKESENLTMDIFKELIEKDMLESGAKVLGAGEGSALAFLALRESGFSNVVGVERHPFFSLLKKRFVYALDFKDNYFDFIFSTGFDRVSVPALLVLEIERVLRPSGTGAMLVGSPNFYTSSLARSVTPVSLFLKKSNVVRVCAVGSFMLVIFKKRFDSFTFFDQYRLPDECSSVANNKPFVNIEPLVDVESGQLESELSYLLKFMNISSRNRLVHMNVGSGELLNSSIRNTLMSNYPIQLQAFDIYVVYHNTSILSSGVKEPGISFFYHPASLGDIETTSSLFSDENLNAPLNEERFDIVRWFEETVADGDFIVLVITARVAELKILFRLFETGEICHIDELFFRCSDHTYWRSAVYGDCMSLFTGLRNGGVFVHQRSVN